jgi:hypothetical protein
VSNLKPETRNLKPRAAAGMEDKAKEFVEKGAEVYAKA